MGKNNKNFSNKKMKLKMQIFELCKYTKMKLKQELTFEKYEK